MRGYQVGDTVRTEAFFYDTQGDLYDPLEDDQVTIAVTCKILTPAGVQIDYVYGIDAQLVRVATGHYRTDIYVDQAGPWQFRYASVGDFKAAAEDGFVVESTTFVI